MWLLKPQIITIAQIVPNNQNASLYIYIYIFPPKLKPDLKKKKNLWNKIIGYFIECKKKKAPLDSKQTRRLIEKERN